MLPGVVSAPPAAGKPGALHPWGGPVGGLVSRQLTRQLLYRHEVSQAISSASGRFCLHARGDEGALEAGAPSG